MRTYKPIATISYIPPSALRPILDSLVDQGVIDFYSFLLHQGENGKKEHVHLYVEPTMQIDTASKEWRTLFTFEDLSTMPWHASKFDDWFLYTSHNKAYLDSKRLKKQYYDYDIANFVASDSFIDRARSVDFFDYLSPIEKIVSCVLDGNSLVQAMTTCRVSYGAMAAFKLMYEVIKNEIFPQQED